ncbi:MAG TPA: Holliday junction resolvase RuvX [Candidatus Saccharimonadales bacterium]|jgi:putative Holliday junction resolvase
MQSTATFLALDVGERRIGVALADAGVRFAQPLTTLETSTDILAQIQKLIDEHRVATVVVGLPRGLDGQETAQTRAVKTFVENLKQHTEVPIVWQDEALTSVKAEAELTSRDKHGVYNKSDVDALAATYILEDFIAEHSRGDT